MDAIYTAEYWNDVDVEKSKQWWIESPDDSGVRDYLQHSGLMNEFEACVPALEVCSTRSASGRAVILDLAAGTGWSAALLSRLSFVGEVHAVEISEHRLGALFETTVASLDGDPTKISRYLGSFYDVHLPDVSVDAVFLSQAFHHADEPQVLLGEIRRVLRRGGLLTMIGEHKFGMTRHIRQIASVILRQHRIPRSWAELYPPDPLLGDHYYSRGQYDRMLRASGFEPRYDTSTGSLIILARKDTNSV